VFIVSLRSGIALALLALSSSLTTTHSPVGSRLVHDTVVSKALAGNRLGDSPARELLVYLPASYETDPARRYPVLYFLHGFTSKPIEWMDGSYPGFNLQTTLDTLIARRTIPDLIVVMPDADNALGGGFYENSPIAGNWADFVVRDVVGYIDGRYRTIADRRHRALAGHSMGGFGALALGFTRPEEFGLVYAMSPCCLAFVGEMAPESPAWNAAAQATSWDVRGTPSGTNFIVALAAALSPAPERTPAFGALPFGSVDGRVVVNQAVKARWESRLPIALAQQMIARRADAPDIYLDYGTRDQVASVDPGVAELRKVLDASHVRYGDNAFDGGHIDHLPERITEHMLPVVGAWLQQMKR
jgi:S-formylglutathione hydrolase FrmB